MRYNLDCKYDSRKSFYGKAQIEYGVNVINLYSYNTLVASVEDDASKRIFKLYGYNVNGKERTQTTTRHIKEFLKQEELTEEEIKELFDKGVLRYEL